MRVLGRLVVAAAVACVGAPAWAQAVGEADWACWYEGGLSIHCVLLRLPIEAPAPIQPERVAPSARPLPVAAERLLRRDADLLGRMVVIPMMSEPDDLALVRQLAHSTVCGGAADCQVDFVLDGERILDLRQQLAAGRP